MKKYKVALIGILTFGVSYLVLILLTALQNNNAFSSNNTVDVYLFTSYMKTLISSVLLLISTIVTCTYIIVDAIKKKK